MTMAAGSSAPHDEAEGAIGLSSDSGVSTSSRAASFHTTDADPTATTAAAVADQDDAAHQPSASLPVLSRPAVGASPVAGVNTFLSAPNLTSPSLSPTPQLRPPLAPSRQGSHLSSSSTSRLTPALQVRAGLLARIYRGLGEMRGNRRTGLLLMGLVTFAQLVAFVTVLAVSAGQSCDQPLRTYIIVHTVRVTLSWPASFYLALAPRRPSRNDTNPEETRRSREARRVFGTAAWDQRIKMFQDIMSLLAFTWFLFGNYLFFSAKTCKSTSPELYWTSLAVVILGWLYALEIIFLVLAVTFFLPVVIIGIRLFGWGSKKQEIGPCDQQQIDKIPLVLYVPAPEDPNDPAAPADTLELGPMSTPPEDEDQTPTPADEEEKNDAEIVVNDIPTPQPIDAADKPDSSPLATANTEPGADAGVLTAHRSRRRRKLARLFFSVKRRPAPHSGAPNDGQTFSTPSDSAYIPTPFPLQPLPANQSTCPICLCDFEAPPASGSGVDPATYPWEPLRRLPACGHCFHKDCLDEWLGTSGRCPLCQVPVEGNDRKGKRSRRRRRGSRFRSSSSGAEEEDGRGGGGGEDGGGEGSGEASAGAPSTAAAS